MVANEYFIDEEEDEEIAQFEKFVTKKKNRNIVLKDKSRRAKKPWRAREKNNREDEEE